LFAGGNWKIKQTDSSGVDLYYCEFSNAKLMYIDNGSKEGLDVPAKVDDNVDYKTMFDGLNKCAVLQKAKSKGL